MALTIKIGNVTQLNRIGFNSIISNSSKYLPILYNRQFYNTFVFKNNVTQLTIKTHFTNTTPNLFTFRKCSSVTKIYTKTGDKGTSVLYTGERRPKDDLFFNALGSIDELSSFIGLAKEFALEKNHDYVEQLERIQCILQDIGTIIASPIPKELSTSEKERDLERMKRLEKRITFNKRHIDELEAWIDNFTENLPPLTNFIIPGGGRISASLHISRTICRRAERTIIPLTSQDLVDANILKYINRLSDYLFTIARHATILDGKKETIYIRPKPQKEVKDEEKSFQEKREKG